MDERRLQLLIVGAFPARPIVEHGGVLTSCRVLLGSSLPQRADLILVDSSSPTVPPPPYLNRLWRALQRLAKVARLLKVPPDAALFFASPGASFIEKSVMALAARLRGTRTLMFPRGAGLLTQYRSSRLHGALLKRCFAIPDVMLCQGSTYREFFVHEVGLSAERCLIVPNWTATQDLLDIGAARTERGSKVVQEILFLGWVDREKGIFELLQCVQRLAAAAEVPPFRVVIAGDGSAMAEARRRVKLMRLEDTIEFLGWIDAQAKLGVLRSADLLVLPSYMEGMPNSVIEAMAAGLPVVATAVGEVGEVVADGISGLVVSPRDIDSLLAALQRLMLDPALRFRMGQAGWKIAQERFGVERAVDQIVKAAGATLRQRQAAPISE